MRTVRHGMEGYGVKLLQYGLLRAGLDVGNLDGIFGRRTARALLRFQRAEGLAADGVAGKLTWAALYPYMAGYRLHGTRQGAAETVALDLKVVTGLIPSTTLLVGLMAKGLIMRYPFLRVEEIGRSVMGQRLISLSMGTGRRQVGCVGPHRANDRWAAAALLRFLENYAAAYAGGGSIGDRPAGALYDAVTLRMVPLPNPDGADLAAGALDPADSFFAQAAALAAPYPETAFPDGWEANVSGVDLDLQYPAAWTASRRTMAARGIARPGPRGYGGSEPLIAPEVRALVRWTEAVDPDALLCFDGGYMGWVREALGPAAVQLAYDPGADFERACRELFPHLRRGLIFSP